MAGVVKKGSHKREGGRREFVFQSITNINILQVLTC